MNLRGVGLPEASPARAEARLLPPSPMPEQPPQTLCAALESLETQDWL